MKQRGETYCYGKRKCAIIKAMKKQLDIDAKY